MQSIQELYKTEIKKKLQEEFKITNPMELPKLTKIVVNIGLGEALGNKKVIEEASRELAVITGQKPLVTHANRAIAAFKLRVGDAIGLKVTLRGERMYDFFTKLIRIVFPRMRDFRGLGRGHFDGQGNFTLGFREQIVFPEIEYAKIDKLRGLEVTIVTNAKTDKKAERLLELLGMPFQKKVEEK